MNDIRVALNRVARLYARRFPVDRGKWRLIQALRPMLVGSRFSDQSTYFGLQIVCDLHEWVGWQVYYFGYNYNERAHTRFFRNVLRPGQVVLDVGANMGYYTLLAAQGVGEEGEVHSFEPVERTFERLSYNVRLNGLRNVRLNRLVVSDSPGEMVVHVAPESNIGMSSLAVPACGSTRTEQVRALTVNDYCADHRIDRVDLLKIDTEGAELQVLRGASEVLRRNPSLRILAEVHGGNLARFGDSAEGIGSYLQEFGLLPHRITESGPVRVSEVPEDNLVLFCREEH